MPLTPPKFSLIFLIILPLISPQFFNMRIDIPPKEEQCLTEYIFKDTVVWFEINSISFKTKLIIKDPKNTPFLDKNGASVKHTFVTKEDGDYTICVRNLDTKNNEVTIEYKSGVMLNDFSSVPKMKNIEPIEQQLDAIISRQNVMLGLAVRSARGKKDFEEHYKTTSSKIIRYSILMIIGMVVVAGTETFYLKKFMERRKII